MFLKKILGGIGTLWGGIILVLGTFVELNTAPFYIAYKIPKPAQKFFALFVPFMVAVFSAGIVFTAPFSAFPLILVLVASSLFNSIVCYRFYASNALQVTQGIRSCANDFAEFNFLAGLMRPFIVLRQQFRSYQSLMKTIVQVGTMHPNARPEKILADIRSNPKSLEASELKKQEEDICASLGLQTTTQLIDTMTETHCVQYKKALNRLLDAPFLGDTNMSNIVIFFVVDAVERMQVVFDTIKKEPNWQFFLRCASAQKTKPGSDEELKNQILNRVYFINRPFSADQELSHKDNVLARRRLQQHVN